MKDYFNYLLCFGFGITAVFGAQGLLSLSNSIGCEDTWQGEVISELFVTVEYRADFDRYTERERLKILFESGRAVDAYTVIDGLNVGDTVDLVVNGCVSPKLLSITKQLGYEEMEVEDGQ